jgi:hypothetical protein
MQFLFVFALVTGLVSALAGGQQTAPAAPEDPQTEALRHYMDSQTNAAHNTNLMLVVSEFISTNAAVRYSLTDHWQEHWRTIGFCSGGMQIESGNGPFHHKLREQHIQAMESAILELPSTNAVPPFDELVLVSFRQGTNWITRSYDKRSLPKALRQIDDIRRAQWVRSFTVQ